MKEIWEFCEILSAVYDFISPLCDEPTFELPASFGRKVESAFDGHSLINAQEENFSAQFFKRVKFRQDVYVTGLPRFIGERKCCREVNVRRLPDGNGNRDGWIVSNGYRKCCSVPRSAVAVDRCGESLCRFLVSS